MLRYRLSLLITSFVVLSGVTVFGSSLFHVLCPPTSARLKPAEGADVALVLGGDPGTRTQRAVELFHAGRVQRLLFSGAGHGGDDAEVLAEQAVAAGVPRSRIILEPRARSTIQNLVFSARILQRLGAGRVVIVTHSSHVGRVLWLVDRLGGLNPGGEVVVEPVDSGDELSKVPSEMLKLTFTRWVLWFYAREVSIHSG